MIADPFGAYTVTKYHAKNVNVLFQSRNGGYAFYNMYSHNFMRRCQTCIEIEEG